MDFLKALSDDDDVAFSWEIKVQVASQWCWAKKSFHLVFSEVPFTKDKLHFPSSMHLHNFLMGDWLLIIRYLLINFMLF